MKRILNAIIYHILGATARIILNMVSIYIVCNTTDVAKTVILEKLVRLFRSSINRMVEWMTVLHLNMRLGLSVAKYTKMALWDHKIVLEA